MNDFSLTIISFFILCGIIVIIYKLFWAEDIKIREIRDNNYINGNDNKFKEQYLEIIQLLNNQKNHIILGQERDNIIKEAIQKLENKLEGNKNEVYSLNTLIDQHQNTTKGLREQVNILSNTLSNNQLRGMFGQESAESILRLIGLVKGTHYTVQETQTTGNKPDITFYLPNDRKINIDVKFPFQSLKKYLDADNKDQKKEFKKNFQRDIKNHISAINSRSYTNTKDDTIDFAIMFVPNEMVFNHMYDICQDEFVYAQDKKILICSPISFTAILRITQQFSNNLKYQKNLSKVGDHIKDFEKEYCRFDKEINELGKKIKKLNDIYDSVERVRNKKLNLCIKNIKSLDSQFEQNTHNIT